MFLLNLRTENGLCLLLRGIARSSILILVLASHILCHKGALGVADSIETHLFVAAEIRALKGTFGRSHLREHIRIEFMPKTVPKEFLALIYQTIDIPDTYTTAQMP